MTSSKLYPYFRVFITVLNFTITSSAELLLSNTSADFSQRTYPETPGKYATGMSDFCAVPSPTISIQSSVPAAESVISANRAPAILAIKAFLAKEHSLNDYQMRKKKFSNIKCDPHKKLPLHLVEMSGNRS